MWFRFNLFQSDKPCTFDLHFQELLAVLCFPLLLINRQTIIFYTMSIFRWITLLDFIYISCMWNEANILQKRSTLCQWSENTCVSLKIGLLKRYVGHNMVASLKQKSLEVIVTKLKKLFAILQHFQQRTIILHISTAQWKYKIWNIGMLYIAIYRKQ